MANRQGRRAAAAHPAPEPHKPTGATGVLPYDTEITANNAISFYASGAQMSQIANDVILTFTGTKSGTVVLPGGEVGNVIQVMPVADVTVSVMTFAEIVFALQKQLELYEAEHGEVSTPFLKAQKALKAQET